MKNILIILTTLICSITHGQKLRLEEDFYQGGQLYSRGYFKKVNKNMETSFGLWTYWYENGQKKSEELYNEGKKTKYINFWLPNGLQTLRNGNGYIIEDMAFRMQDSTVFNIKDSLKNGQFVSYLKKDGTTEKISTGTFKDGFQQGIDTMFYPSGRIRLTRTFIDGEENGISTKYYENGIIEEQGYFVEIYREGLWSYYDTLGRLKLTINYRRNKMLGEYSEYFPNGQLKMRGSYKVIRVKNKSQSPPKRPKSFGSGYGTTPYIDKSLKHGTWLYYSEKGELMSTLNYTDGKVN